MFTFGDFRTRSYRLEILECMGIADCPRLLPAVRRGLAAKPPLVGGGRPAASPAGDARLVDVVCTALARGLYDPTGKADFSIFGSTDMHMRYVPIAAEVKPNAARSGYTMCLPIDGACASMQSNIAASLNIGWILVIACEAGDLAGARTSRKTLLNGLDTKILAAQPWQAIFPYILEAGERGPFLDPNARAQFIGLSSRIGLLCVVRAVYEGLAFAARDCYAASGSASEEVRIGGGAARSAAPRTIVAAALGSQVRGSSRQELGSAGAAMMAAVCSGVYPGVGACAEDWVAPSLRATTASDPDLVDKYAKACPIYRMAREAMTPATAKLAELKGEDH